MRLTADDPKPAGAVSRSDARLAAPAKPLSPKALARIKGAASFVGKKAGTVINDTKEAIDRITDGMTEYQTRPRRRPKTRAIAKAIRGNAESLEEVSIETNQSLNRAFKAAYEAADAA